MRILLFLVLGLLFSTNTFAQASAHKASEINFFTQKLSLDKGQVEKLNKIIERKYLTFDKLQSRKAQYDTYVQKVSALQKGTLNSIQLILTSPAQNQAFRSYRMELRKQRADFIKQKRKDGLSPKVAKGQYYLDAIFPKG